tara:strand:- start:667 stop:1017 length:351 start_codon:yes stop_codon:yes gene_type:complete
MIRDYAEHVYKILGPGYSERVYHNAMEVVLRKNGVHYETERIVPIEFEGHIIGNLRADLILNNKTVIELKSVKNMTEVMVTQAHNYLRLTGFPEAYLINFPTTVNTDLEIRYVGIN